MNMVTFMFTTDLYNAFEKADIMHFIYLTKIANRELVRLHIMTV